MRVYVRMKYAGLRVEGVFRVWGRGLVVVAFVGRDGHARDRL